MVQVQIIRQTKMFKDQIQYRLSHKMFYQRNYKIAEIIFKQNNSDNN